MATVMPKTIAKTLKIFSLLLKPRLRLSLGFFFYLSTCGRKELADINYDYLMAQPEVNEARRSSYHPIVGRGPGPHRRDCPPLSGHIKSPGPVKTFLPLA